VGSYTVCTDTNLNGKDKLASFVGSYLQPDLKAIEIVKVMVKIEKKVEIYSFIGKVHPA